MRRSCSVLLLVGCNQVYGLDPTRASDAAYFDAPPDAPYACPPIGTPPRFSRNFEQVVVQNCNNYTVSITGRALARCAFNGDQLIAEGAIGERLQIAPGFDANSMSSTPRIGPDGQHAIVRQDQTFYLFERGSAGWARKAPIEVPPPTVINAVSAPTRVGRIILVTSGEVRELADDGNGSFTQIRAQTFGELDLNAVTSNVNLTADGLRLVFNGNLNNGSQLLYTDRPSLDVGFRIPVAMPEVDFLSNGFMTEDCAHLYFSGLNNVFATRPM
jgi:hypothetical protein